MLTFFDTMQGTKVPFEPIRPPKVGIYVCGPTVYDQSHLGHARAYVTFDVIVRYLRSCGFDVTYVRNFTDIDDKIIARARERGMDPMQLAGEFIEMFHEDMEALKVDKADVEPRVSEHIPQIIAMVQTLVDKGLAYVTEAGNVYFAVRAFPSYGKLSRRNIDDMRAGARVEADPSKRDPLDFALWKAAKPSEPMWESPWGKGRPGWHIECSAMSTEYLGKTFDIHGGGKDLVDSMHHENEIAQSQGANGQDTFARFWIHNGFVQFNGEKMSKSLGNFFTIRELTSRFEPETIRYYLLTAHYRGPINLEVRAFCPSCKEVLPEQGPRPEEKAASSKQEICPHCRAVMDPSLIKETAQFPGLSDAESRLAYLYETLSRMDDFMSVGKEPAKDGPVLEPAGTLMDQVRSAMDNDFNTAAAIGALSEVFRLANRLLDDPKAAPKDVRRRTLGVIRADMASIGRMLGILGDDPISFLDRRRNRHALALKLDPAEIEQQIGMRAEARRDRDFGRADQIRESLARRGVELMDTPRGTRWRIAVPE